MKAIVFPFMCALNISKNMHCKKKKTVRWRKVANRRDYDAGPRQYTSSFWRRFYLHLKWCTNAFENLRWLKSQVVCMCCLPNNDKFSHLNFPSSKNNISYVFWVRGLRCITKRHFQVSRTWRDVYPNVLWPWVLETVSEVRNFETWLIQSFYWRVCILSTKDLNFTP